jgi:hypothetical protein
MSKTLVILLSETRAHELTFVNFKKNVIDELHADLCICIGVKQNYDYQNPFYQLAKYRFLYDEPEDYGDAFEYAYQILSKNIPPHDEEKNDTSTKPIHWREFLKIKDQFLGGIKDKEHQHDGSAGILIFFRWFLLHNLHQYDLINQYDRFIITRSDFIYQLPHPSLDIMYEDFIWIPDCEHYGGYTDRHVILSKKNIESYLNILHHFVVKSNEYFDKMKNYNKWNLEKVIKFHLEQNQVLHLVKEFPYIMYSVRNKNGTTRWSAGKFSKEFGYFIKYESEFQKSTEYKKKWKKSKLSIHDFYKKHIHLQK